MSRNQKPKIFDPRLIERVEAHLIHMESNGMELDQEEPLRLLALEAVNTWSAGALGEGADVKFVVGGTRPCFATFYELESILDLLHVIPAIFYPSNGFSLPDDPSHTGLKYSYSGSAFRMRPHISGCRARAISIAENCAINDPESAFDLWLVSAAESSMESMYVQMGNYGLCLDDVQKSAIRAAFRDSLAGEFSLAQMWNVTWRAVQNAAALSSREYYNRDRAAKTIPNKIAKLITQARSGELQLTNYDRPYNTYTGAVLTLFHSRFGVTDQDVGHDVLEKLCMSQIENPSKAPRPADGIQPP